MKVLTREQRVAIKKLYDRNWDKPGSYLEFRRTVNLSWDCAMVPWCDMWIGIETDGYTHS